MQSQQPIFPVTKVVMRKRPTPQDDPNVIRFTFLEKPYRWYHALSFHSQAFIKTVVLSFILVVPSYHFVYMVASCRSRAEIMGKMDPYFTSDQLKEAIVDFRAREEMGKIETYDKSELKKELGGEELGYNIGLSPSLKAEKPSPNRRSYF